MEFETKLNQLKEILGEIVDLNAVGALLGWDQQTYMPRGGAEARGYQSATIGKIAHEKFISEEVGKLLDELTQAAADLDPDSDDARLIKITRRRFDKSTRVPREYIIEMAQITSLAHQTWQQARNASPIAACPPSCWATTTS